MRKHTHLIIAFVCILGSVAFADWDEGDPALFYQLPDLSSNGMDVMIQTPPGGGFNVHIADDFSVSSDQKMLDIHFWGSWLNDVVPLYGAQDITFDFFLFDDIPAYIGGKPYSRPDEYAIWSKYDATATSVRQYATELNEGWYEPGFYEDTYLPEGDTVCWQYNFDFDPAGAFDLEANKVYWLLIWATPGQASPQESDPLFGWKTSCQHWNDVATYRDGAKLPPEWRPLEYPDGHLYEGQGIDMAFVITPEPATLALLSLGGLALVRRRK